MMKEERAKLDFFYQNLLDGSKMTMLDKAELPTSRPIHPSATNN